MLRFTLVALTAVTLAVTPLLVLASPLGEPTLLDPLPGASSTDPAVVGKWSAPFEGQVPAISMALLPNGAILYWAGVEANERDNVFFTATPYGARWAVMMPPYTDASVTELTPPRGLGDLFCAGQTIMPDGSVLTAGGSEWQSGTDPNYRGFVSGLAETWSFSADTMWWAREPDMQVKRWYPTVMTLADGSALAASGIQDLLQPQTHNTLLEQYTEADGWTSLQGADNLLPMYPRLFTVPSGPMKGDLFYETSGTLWGPFGERPDEALWSLEQRFDLEEGTWESLGPSVFGARQHAATVMLPLDPADGYKARVMTFGGSIYRSVAATSATEITDLSTVPPTHQVADPLDHPRWFGNGVLLPDGDVLAVGGGMYDNVYAHGQPVPAVLVAETYDPETDAWTQMASQQVPRMYHSTALLLPDGRVLSGGHVALPVPWKDARDNVPYQAQPVETRFEIYEPPYLHWGATRPVIEASPASVGYGETFTVTAADASLVKDAVLVHPGATTHVWDSTQRVVGLEELSRSGNQITFLAPPDGDVATPGPWMLFLRSEVEGKGLVPSVATFVTVS